MWTEKNKSYLNEQERKKLEKTEQEEKAEQEKILEFQKTKEYIREEEKTSDDLSKLKDLLEDHIIDDELVQKVISWAEIEHEELEEIFAKIDEIDAVEDIDKYLPKELRVTKEEYSNATHDEVYRVQLITKLNSALTVLANSISDNSWIWSINIFSGFMTLLDKNLILIQEHHIDIKDSLEEIDKDKKQNKSLWEEIIDFFKEIFK